MPRTSKKRRLEWSFFLRQVKVGNTTCDRITYNDLCRGCTHSCKQSFRAVVVLCPPLFFKAEKTAEGAPMTDKKHSTASTTDRRPDCVTETRMGNTVLIVSGYFKKDTTATAADKMMKVLEAETAAAPRPPYTA